MKTFYTLLALALLTFSSNAQECVEFSEVDNPGWLFDYGTSIYTGDDIELLTGWNYQHYGVFDGSLNFSGYLKVDVSKSDCMEKELQFNGVNAHVVVDNDTIKTDGPGFVFPVYGLGYSLNYDSTNGVYTVTGDFNVIELGYSTNSVNKICYSEYCLDVSAESLESPEIKVFPNPAENIINIDADFEKLEIVNLLGETVLAVNQQVKSVDVSGLATGTYFVKATNGNTSSMAKFIKK